MKILIVTNMAPFTAPASENKSPELTAHLETHLLTAGHEVEILRLPFQRKAAASQAHILRQMLMISAFELPAYIDQVIALQFPSYLIKHPRKTLWLQNHYDPASSADHPPGPSLSKHSIEMLSLIKNADSQAFRECHRIFTTSKKLKDKLVANHPCDKTEFLPIPQNTWSPTIEKLLS